MNDQLLMTSTYILPPFCLPLSPEDSAACAYGVVDTYGMSMTVWVDEDGVLMARDEYGNDVRPRFEVAQHVLAVGSART